MLREWNAGEAPASGLVNHRNHPVSVDRREFGLSRQPPPSKSRNDQQQVTTKAARHVVEVSSVKMGEWAWFDPGQIFRSQPPLAALIVDPSHSMRLEPEPREIERFDLFEKRRVVGGEAILQVNLLDSRDRLEFALQKKPIGDAHSRSRIAPSPLGVGREVREHCDRRSAAVAMDRDRGDDWPTTSSTLSITKRAYKYFGTRSLRAPPGDHGFGAASILGACCGGTIISEGI